MDKSEVKQEMAKKFICSDCNFMFYIRSKPTKKGKLFCPNCGENAAVSSIEKKIERRPWTTKEEELIDQIIEGKLQKYQVASMLGRTYVAVQRRVEIHVKQRKKVRV
jgi:uncharacterized Zn finger protein (UPF0148 family)